MKTTLAIVAALITTPVNAALLGMEVDWAFIQAVGGLSIGTPYSKGDVWFLPLRCDVSGTQTITTEPTQVNSGLWVAGIEFSIEESEILITVETSPFGKSPTCGDVKLGSIKRKTYQVVYEDPDGKRTLIGSVNAGL